MPEPAGRLVMGSLVGAPVGAVMGGVVGAMLGKQNMRTVMIGGSEYLRAGYRRRGVIPAAGWAARNDEQLGLAE